MQTAPKPLTVSVIVPTYNRADLLVEALDSVLRQTRLPDEILVVDDGSTDDTAKVLARYGSPVISLWQPNRGVSAARNLAIERATGDVLIFLDSDDLLLPNSVERCVEVLQSHPDADIVYADVDLIDAQGNRLGILSEVEPGPRPSGDLLGELGSRCVVNLSGTAVRRSSLHDARFDEAFPCAQDYEFWCQLAARCSFHYVDERLSCYRYHGEQVTTLRVQPMLEEAIEIQRRVMRMPEFNRVSRRDRAKVMTTHGLKHALCRRTGVARLYFWRGIESDPRYVTAWALLGFGLLGGPFLRWTISLRRRLRGNYIEEQAIRLATQTAGAAPVVQPPPVAAALAGAAGSAHHE